MDRQKAGSGPGVPACAFGTVPRTVRTFCSKVMSTWSGLTPGSSACAMYASRRSATSIAGTHTRLEEAALSAWSNTRFRVSMRSSEAGKG